MEKAGKYIRSLSITQYRESSFETRTVQQIGRSFLFCSGEQMLLPFWLGDVSVSIVKKCALVEPYVGSLAVPDHFPLEKLGETVWYLT